MFTELCLFYILGQTESKLKWRAERCEQPRIITFMNTYKLEGSEDEKGDSFIPGETATISFQTFLNL